MLSDHARWLLLHQEPIIEPNLPVCDPHHHLWKRPGQTYLLNELQADLGSGHNIVKTVFVECSYGYRESGPEPMRPVGETEFVTGVAESAANCPTESGTQIAKGIVGHANLMLGDRVAEVLEAHVEVSKGRFRGIRDSAASDVDPTIGGYKSPAPGRLLDPTFREGFARLAPLGLSFDAWLYHAQIPELVDLARAFPETTIILDHVAPPLHIGHYVDQRWTTDQVWRLYISELAKCPNVVVKVGGMAMAMWATGWGERPEPPSSEEMAEAMRPYYLWVIKQFGTKRCMFESNFPVDNAGSSYRTLWNAFKRVSKGFSDGERADLFLGTASRAYRV